MFPPMLHISNISKKLLFFGAFLLLGFSGYGQATVAFSAATASSAENTGANVPTLIVDGTVVAPSTATLTPGGTATGGTDYTLASTTINIPAGVYTNTVFPLGLTITGDTAVELDETITLGLGGTGDVGPIAPSTTTYTILNDDGAATVAFSAATASSAENTGANVPTLIVDGTVVAPSTATLTPGGTATGGTDYTLASTTINIPAGVYTNTVFPLGLTITGDTAVELDETITLGLGGTGDVGPIAPSTTTYTILNDDGAATVAFSAATASSAENTGANVPTLIVDGTVVAPSTATLTPGGTATGGTDYTLASTTINIPAGVYTNTVFPLGLTITGDTAVELDETITLGLGGTGDVGPIAPSTTTYTILNDDGAATVAFSAATASSAENTGANVPTLIVDGTVVAPSTATLTPGGTATGGTDYTLASTTINIPAGVYTNTVFPLGLTITGDTAVELDETITLGLGGTGDVGPIAPSTTTYTILNDDGAATVAFSAATASSAENTGANVPTLIVDGTVVAPSTATLTPGGTATGGTDYTLASTTINIPAGVYTNTVFPLGLTITGDTAVELDETITLGLGGTGDVGPIAPSTTTYTILNDDGAATVAFSAATASSAENTGANVPTLIVDGTVVAPSTATLTPGGTATGGTDYTLASTTINIPAGVYTNTVFPLGLTITGDTAVELDETITLGLGGTGDVGPIAPSTTTYTILNDDGAATVAFSAATASSAENTGANVPTLIVDGTVVAPSTATLTPGGTATEARIIPWPVQR